MGSPDPLISFRRVPERAGLQREELEAFAQSLKAKLTGDREFHCRITGDAELRRLNSAYLEKDYAADVLSFPSGDADFLGDLAISYRRAAAQASEFGHSVTQEIQLLLLHGVLHLMGFDHDRDHGEMARAERRWQVKLGLPASLTGRAAHHKATV
jgi:probable rRNA maturation factor